MTSVYRSRVRPYGTTPGNGTKQRTTTTYSNYAVVGVPSVSSTSVTYRNGQEECKDRVQLNLPFEDHDLELKKFGYTSFLRLNGTVRSPAVIPKFGSQTVEVLTNWSSSAYASALSTGLPTLSSPDWTNYENAIVKRINRLDQPIVDVPLFLFELREFPGMLRDLGRVLRKEVSSQDVPGGYLAYQFGWAPLISDLKSLFDLQAEIDRRLKNLRDARRGKKLHGSLSTMESVTEGTDVQVYALGSLTTKIRATLLKSERAWYTGTWVVHDNTALNAFISSYENKDIQSYRRLLGFDRMSASTLWNAIPWSWLLDYFSNVGDLLEELSGNLPMHVENLNIMVHQKLTQTHIVIENSAGVSVSVPRFMREHKYRKVIPAPSTKLALNAILTGGQTAILGALATSRALQRTRKG